MRNENIELLDSNTSGLTSYDDLADVDLEFYDIYNNKIFELKETDTSGTIPAPDFNSEDKLGYWGLAIYGASKNYE